MARGESLDSLCLDCRIYEVQLRLAMLLRDDAHGRYHSVNIIGGHDPRQAFGIVVIHREDFDGWVTSESLVILSPLSIYLVIHGTNP